VIGQDLSPHQQFSPRVRASRFAPVALLMLALLLLLTASMQPAHAARNKYAALVVDPKRQLVLFERYADHYRHPASLTKVMTIYMTFEAVKSGKFKWNTRLPVSARAAAQPQTNISLRKGSRISVRELVKSLIVRSANDSAVVLAEGLGKTEWNFAKLMTKKARKLGMKKTSFRNASGLHDPGQKTTARDMVKLALAIQKHFPEYYHMFNETRFRYKGRTYHSHNRVTRFYKGATGMKTGYVRASGFNLITTAKRGQNEVIGVVMGGRSSKSRDSHMITLLDDAFATLGRRNQFFKRFASYVPRPIASKPKPDDTLQLASAEDIITLPSSKPSPFSVLEPQGSSGASFAVQPEEKPLRTNQTPVFKPVSYADQGTLEMDVQRQWAIQVGTFTDARNAMMAAANAMDMVDGQLKGAVVRVANFGRGRSQLHRAHLANLTEKQARKACRTLNAMKESCFVFKEGQLKNTL
jgi:D-alanyl-D-alanine carboxypeptidase